MPSTHVGQLDDIWEKALGAGDPLPPPPTFAITKFITVAGWNTPGLVPISSQPSVHADIAIGPDGSKHIVWSEADNHVWYMRLDQNDRIAVPAQDVFFNGRFPVRIAVDGNNNAHIVATTSGSVSIPVYIKINSDGTEAFHRGVHFPITTDPRHWASDIDVRGNTAVLITQVEDIVAGRRFEAIKIANLDPTDGTPTYYENCFFRWDTYNMNAVTVQGAVDSNGVAHAVWVDYVDGLPVLRHCQEGELNIVTIAGGNPFLPDFKAGPGGRLHVAWEDSTSGEVYYARLLANASVDVGPLQVSNTISGSLRASVAATADNGAYVVWAEGDAQPRSLYFAELSSGGVLSRTQRLSEAPWNAWLPRVATGNQAVPHLAWTDMVSGEQRIWYTKRRCERLDLSADAVLPVQVVEGQNLVKDKATAAKVVIQKAGCGIAENVSVRLTHGSTVLTDFYVAEPGNLNAQRALIASNTTYSLTFATSEVTKTIYFFGDGLAPTSNPFQATAEVDYRGTISETDETNNLAHSLPTPVYDVRWTGSLFPNLYIHYFPTDNVPRADLDAYYRTSNNFLRGVYPVSERRFTPGRSFILTGNTSGYRGSDGLLDELELTRWIANTLPRLRLAHPTADRFIATVPVHWFSLNTTGTLTNAVGVAHPAMRRLVVSEARTTARPNGPSIAAHEIGHSYGLRIACEEYDANCDGTPDRIGLRASTGLWVEQRIPIHIPDERNVFCFMGAYNPDLEYWVDADDYFALMNPLTTTVALATAAPATTTLTILAVGTLYSTGTMTLDNWYILPEAELDALSPGPYSFEYKDPTGGTLNQVAFDLSFTLEGYTLTQAPFVFTIPYIPGTAKILVKQADLVLAEKIISANAPTVTVMFPNGSEQLSGELTIEWLGNDADGDILSYVVLVSPDTGTTWEPIAGNLTATSYTWPLSQLPAGSQYLVKIVATDGINTGQDVSDAPFAIRASTYLPLVLRNH
jgi:hypothetical protein